MATYDPKESERRKTENNICSSDEESETIQKKLISDPSERSSSEKSKVEKEEITQFEEISNDTEVVDLTDDWSEDDQLDVDEKEFQQHQRIIQEEQEQARKQKELLEWQRNMNMLYNQIMKIINENEF